MSDDRKNLTTVGQRSLSMDFGTPNIDLSGLTPEMRAEVEKYAAMKKIDVAASLVELKRDLQATSESMNNVADVARRMTESGDAVTIRQKIKNVAGEIELLAGNTEEAKKGQTSVPVDKTWMYVVGGIAAAIVVAILLSR
jgi:hypothetical protein